MIDVEALEQEASCLIDDKRYQEAYDILFPLIEMNSEYATVTIALMYELGRFGDPNLELAKSLYERATQYEDASGVAFHYLGCFHRDQNAFDEARPAFEKAAELDHMGGMYALGELLFDGQGGLQDQIVGLKWIKQAADMGHFLAKRKLIFIEISQTKSFFRVPLEEQPLRLPVGYWLQPFDSDDSLYPWKNETPDRASVSFFQGYRLWHIRPVVTRLFIIATILSGHRNTGSKCYAVRCGYACARSSDRFAPN